MLAIVGTVPDLTIPLLDGPVTLEGDTLMVNGHVIAPDRGTPALLMAAVRASSHLGLPLPHAFLIGDQGLGAGSRELYRHMVEVLPERLYSTIVFHYLQPDVDWHNRIILTIQAMSAKPKLIADAGFMYAAKMSGQASAYDLFTPDAGELAFLADETAPHPFYTRGFILHDDNNTPDLITRAYTNDNAASFLLVKGNIDYIANGDGVLATVSEPAEEAMEAMGGTGDTVTGIVSALIESGRSIPESARIAAQANRFAGSQAKPNPGSHIFELVPHIPSALSEAIHGTLVKGTDS
jgi:NAD(P)H-hydrate repair Nnr-like enzyme with NAD(P)H-hydrate dehydratase domain